MSCTYRQALRGFIRARSASRMATCLTAHDVADSTNGACSVVQVRKHLARAERAGLIKTRVMKVEHAQRHRRRRVPLRVKCYIRVPLWRRR